MVGYRNGELSASRLVPLAPATVTQDVPASRPGPVDPPDLSRTSQVETALSNGRRLIVPAGIDSEALAWILRVVDGR